MGFCERCKYYKSMNTQRNNHHPRHVLCISAFRFMHDVHFILDVH